MSQAEPRRLILASQSSARRRLLEAAGLELECVHHDVDEEAVRRQCLARGRSAAATAESLAVEKALLVSRKMPESWVVGGDQLLFREGECYSKPTDLVMADRQLRGLRGRSHLLPTAIALARQGTILWRHSETPELKMRDSSDGFLTDYLKRMGERVLSTVGCYELEGEGIQLFERVRGDGFTIQGLPLLPLLAELRRQGFVAT